MNENERRKNPELEVRLTSFDLDLEPHPLDSASNQLGAGTVSQ